MVVETSYVTAYLTLTYICITVEYLCCFLVFYTWIREWQLFRFPHIIIFLAAVMNFIRVVVRSLPYFVGRDQLMCPSEEDMIQNQYPEGTAFCKIQGKAVSSVPVIVYYVINWYTFRWCYSFLYTVYCFLVRLLNV
jgi:hypothetical protein